MRVPRHLKHPIALWLIDGREALVPPETPRDIAGRLGVDEATVRRWESARAGETRNLPSPARVEALEKILGRPSPERAAPALEATIVARLDEQTRLLERLVAAREARADHAGDSIDPDTVRRRRRYWIDRARSRLAPPGKDEMSVQEIADRMGLEGNTRNLVGRWIRGTIDVDPGYFERLARALHIPVRDIENPPVTDEERLDRWAREFTEIEAPSAPIAERRRAS